MHPRDRAMSARLLEEAQEALNSMEGFADEAERQRGTVRPDGGGAPQSAAPAATTNAMQQRRTVRPHGSGAPQSVALTRGRAAF